MFARNFRTPIAVAALIAGIGLSAQAQTTIDYLSDVSRAVIDTNGRVVRGIVTSNGDIINGSGQVIGHAAVGLIDSHGNIIDSSGKTFTRIYTVPNGSTTTVVTTAPPAVFTEPLGAILDNRRLEIDRMISRAQSGGQITTPQAGEFRSSLGRIEAAEIAARASGGVLSYDEAVDVARDLDSLATSVATASALTPFAPLMVVDPSGAVRFSVAPTGYVTRTTYVPGASSSQTTVSKTVSSDGSSVTRTTTIGAPSVVVESPRLCAVLDSRRDAVATMINDGLAAGKISASQAGDLKAQLDAIGRAESDARLSDNTMTYDEALTIGARLDDLNSRTAAILNLKPMWSIVTVDNGTRRLLLEAPAGATTYSRTTTTTTAPVYADRIIETTTTTTPGTVISTPSGTAVVTQGSAGTVVAVRTVNPTLLISTIEVRRSDLEKLVHQALEKKLITKTQGDIIMSELVRIRTEAVPGISYGRAVILARDLDVITSQVATYGTAVPQPIIAGSHMTISNGEIVELDDVSVRRSDLEARIAKDYLQGRLNSDQANRLRQEMNAIETLEATFRGQHPGDLTLKESRMLYSNCDKVASKLDKWAGKENR